MFPIIVTKGLRSDLVPSLSRKWTKRFSKNCNCSKAKNLNLTKIFKVSLVLDINVERVGEMTVIFNFLNGVYENECNGFVQMVQKHEVQVKDLLDKISQLRSENGFGFWQSLMNLTICDKILLNANKRTH